MPRAASFLVASVLASAGCTNLPPVVPGCGNGVVEPELGETCDEKGTRCGGAGTPNACKNLCQSQEECPEGFACGADGVCRAPTGTLTLAQSVEHGYLRVATADLDGDERGDVVGLLVPQGASGGSPVEVLFSQPAGFFASTMLAETPTPLAPGIADLDGDGVADLATSAGFGLDVRRGQADRSLARDVLFLQYAAGWSPNPPLQSPSDVALIAYRSGPTATLGTAVVDGGKVRVYGPLSTTEFCADAPAGVDVHHMAAIDLASNGGLPTADSDPVVAFAVPNVGVQLMNPSPSGCSGITQPLGILGGAKPTDKVFGTRVRLTKVDEPDTRLVVTAKATDGSDAPPFVLKAASLVNGMSLAPPAQLHSTFPSQGLIAVGDLGHDGSIDAITTTGILVCPKNPVLNNPDVCTQYADYASDPATHALVLDGFGVQFPDVVTLHESGLVRYFNALGPTTFSVETIGDHATAIGATDINGDGIPDVAIAVDDGEGSKLLLQALGHPVDVPASTEVVGRLPSSPIQLLGGMSIFGGDGLDDLAISFATPNGVVPDVAFGFSAAGGLSSPFVAFGSSPDPSSLEVVVPLSAAGGVHEGVPFVASVGAMATQIGLSKPGMFVAVGVTSEPANFTVAQLGLPAALDVPNAYDLGFANDADAFGALVSSYHSFSVPWGDGPRAAVFVLSGGASTEVRAVLGSDVELGALVAKPFSGDYEFVDAAMGDLDGNETPDLVLLTHVSAGDGTFTSQLRVFGDVALAAWLEGGDLVETEQFDLGAGFDPRAIVVIDLDGDPNFREVLVNGPYDPEAPNQRAQIVSGLLRGAAAGPSDYYPLPWGATDMAAGDLDADKIDDLVVSNSDPDKGYDYAAVYLGTYQ